MIKLVVGTKFTSQKDRKEYKVIRRTVYNDGQVRIDISDGTNVYRNAPEELLLDKLSSGALYGHKLMPVYQINIEVEWDTDSTSSILVE